MGTAATHEHGPLERNMVVLQCLGLGLFLSLCPRGPINTALVGMYVGTWTQLTIAQTTHLAATGLAGLALWGINSQGVSLPRAATSRLCYLFVALCFVGQNTVGVADLGVWPLCMFSFAMGVFALYLLMQWFETLLDMCKRLGRAACIGTLGGCYGVAMATVLPASLVAPYPTAALALACLATAGCWGCSELVARYRIAPTPQTARWDRGEHGGYRIVFHTLATLASFGVTYGIAQNLAGMYGEGNGPFCGVGSVMLLAVLCLALMALFFLWRSAGNLQFGYVVRISITVGGSIIAAAPLLVDVNPGFAGLLLRAAGTLLGMAMILFSVEICNDTGTPPALVIPLNYAIWALTCSATMVGFAAIFTFAESSRALNLVTFLAVVATLLIIPILPSRSGNAATFTLAKLPEDESYESRTVRARKSLAAKRGLSSRENEVLDLLLEGCTRQEIAERLTLSAWTVKDHVKSIYRKLNVHSAKELVALFARGE